MSDPTKSIQALHIEAVGEAPGYLMTEGELAERNDFAALQDYVE